MPVDALADALPPLDAWREDCLRLNLVTAADPIADWLVIANALWRVAQLPRPDAANALGRLRDAVRSMVVAAEAASRSARRSSEPRAESAGAHLTLLGDVAHALDLVATDAAFSPASSNDRVALTTRWEAFADRTRAAAASLERYGALSLADSLLVATGVVMPGNLPVAAASVLAQRGRIARQLGRHEAAEALYTAADGIGRRERHLEIRVRATLGLGALATNRGNYPRARALFERALRWAQSDMLEEHVAAAHQGLFAAALASDDVNTALHHGWLAFQHANGDADHQAELVGMLSHIALRVGSPIAALQGYQVSLALATTVRIRLIACGGAALAAAHLGLSETVDNARRQAVEIIARSSAAYESAFVTLDLATAYARLGRSDVARELAHQAEAHAREHQLFEVVHKANELAERVSGGVDQSALDDLGGVPAHLSGRDAAVGRLTTHSAAAASAPVDPSQAERTWPAAETLLSAEARRALDSLQSLRPRPAHPVQGVPC